MKMVSKEFAKGYHQLAQNIRAVTDTIYTLKKESQHHPETVELCNDLIDRFELAAQYFDALVLRTEITDPHTNKTYVVNAWDFYYKQEYLDNR